MTHDTLETYLIQLLPKLRKKHVYTANDDNDCQEALIDLYRKAETFHIATDKEFTSLFLSYYNQIRYRRRCHTSRVQWAESLSNDDYSGQHDQGYNPWDTPYTQAMEYIEYVPNKRIQDFMFAYYIEGYTLQEIASASQLSVVRVHELLKLGVQWIQQSM